MAREVMVPIYKIREISESKNADNQYKAYLENGMTTDITIHNHGKIVTKSNDQSLIEYLEWPLWGNLRFKVFTDDKKISVRKLVEKDISPMAMFLADLEKDLEERKLSEVLTERKLYGVLKAVNDFKMECFVVEMNEGYLGQVICMPNDQVMNLDFALRYTNEEEFKACVKAMKLIMRRLLGIYEFDKYQMNNQIDPAFGSELSSDNNHLALMKALGIESEKYPYILTLDEMAENIEFYLQ